MVRVTIELKAWAAWPVNHPEKQVTGWPLEAVLMDLSRDYRSSDADPNQRLKSLCTEIRLAFSKDADYGSMQEGPMVDKKTGRYLD